LAAVFQVASTFTIPGRGFVIAGQIVEGRIRKGDRVTLPWPEDPGGERSYRISRVEMGDGAHVDGTPFSFVGLVLAEVPAGAFQR